MSEYIDWESRYSGKLCCFRVKELKEVLSELGLSKQGKKQDLLDRLLALLSSEETSVRRGSAQMNHIEKEQVGRIIKDVFRKMDFRNGGDTELATEGLGGLDFSRQKPNEEAEDPSNVQIFCPCGSSLPTESMIQCVDPKCQVQQHIGCVMPMESILPVPPNFYCESCRIKRADPFLVNVEHLLRPTKLSVASADTNGMKPLLFTEKTFELTRGDRNLLRSADYDVQAWCILFNDTVPFRMHWPQHAALQVNDMAVKTITRPGSQLLGANGRDDGALITLFISEGFNKISLSACDDRDFCFGVRFVKRHTVQEVLNLIPKETDGELFEDALSRIRRCIGGGMATANEDSDSDLEVIADSIPVNLRCPMSGSRMKVAGRFKPCAHMGCFDLEIFVELNQRSRKWQCPHCLKNYSLEDIIIDPYFNRITTMMRHCGEDITEIHVKPDGSWSARTNGELSDLARWHFPDGSLCDTAELPEGYNDFKLGLSKNHNMIAGASAGASKDKHMSLSSRNQLKIKFENLDQEIITMSSSASGSCRDGDDVPSTNQDSSGRMVISTNNSNEINSIPCKIDPTHGSGGTNYASFGGADIVILSDSDEENVNFDSSDIVHTTLPVNGGPASRGIQDIDMGNPTIGSVSSCLGLFNGNSNGSGNGNVNDKGVSQWPYQYGNQAGSELQLFGIHPDVTNAYIDSEHTSGTSSEPIDGFRYSKSTKYCGGQLLESSAYDANNDVHDGLVDIPLAFVGEDPPVQNFLLSQPLRVPIQSELEQLPVSNGIDASDWISLRLGTDGVNIGNMGTHAASASTTRLDSGNHCGSNAAAFITAKNNEEGSSSKRTDGRKFSDGPFSFPRQPRSVRRRVFHSGNWV